MASSSAGEGAEEEEWRGSSSGRGSAGRSWTPSGRPEEGFFFWWRSKVEERGRGFRRRCGKRSEQTIDGPFVFLVDQDSKAAMRRISVGQNRDGLAIIEKGLSLDDVVVVDGQYRLRPGIVVSATQAGAAS